jgi:sentrin-specific protease 3
MHWFFYTASFSFLFLCFIGLLSCTLPNGFGGLSGPEGERSLAPPDASILISNVCSIGDHVAQELFQSSDLGIAEEADRTGEKAGQHSPLREEHVTCVQSESSEDLVPFWPAFPIESKGPRLLSPTSIRYLR